MSKKPKEQRVQIATLLSHRTQQGMVQVIWGCEKSQLDPATARQLGTQLLEAAEAAETDEGMWRFGKEHLEFDDAGAAQLMSALVSWVIVGLWLSVCLVAVCVKSDRSEDDD